MSGNFAEILNVIIFKWFVNVFINKYSRMFSFDELRNCPSFNQQ